jgi:hypothetical protein
VAALYTFGSPRGGDEAFRQRFEQSRLPVFRFIHGWDLVTTVPFEEVGYRHVGDLRHIAGDAGNHRLTGDPQPTLLQSYQHNLAAFPKNVGLILSQLTEWKGLKLQSLKVPTDALVDHAPWCYTEKLGAAALESRAIER